VDDLDASGDLLTPFEQAAGKGLHDHQLDGAEPNSSRPSSSNRVVTFIVIALIVIVAALNILIASLTMMVMEKTRDIRRMKLRRRARPGPRIFLLQIPHQPSLARQWASARYLAAWAGGHYHFIHLSAEVYSIDTLPSRLAPSMASSVAASPSEFVLAHALPLIRRRQHPAAEGAA